MKSGFTIKEVKKATGATCAGEEAARRLPDFVSGVSIDSRTVNPGELFVALKGASHDGHHFVAESLSRGASVALVSAEWLAGLTQEERSRPLLSVRDPLRAFQELGRYNRIRVNPRVVAVTGSNGKTTTKEMIAAVSATTYRTARTQGNLNNQFGVPITLLQLQQGDEVAVLELGMNRPGEIARLAELSMPSVGVITNASAAHLEGMDTVLEVAKAKSELADELERDDWLIIHRDSEELFRLNAGKPLRLITFGMSSKSNLRPASVRYLGTEGTELLVDGFPPVRIRLLGTQNVLNALAALAASRALGVRAEEAAAALASVTPTRGRMEMKTVGPACFIDDTYNANPGSMAMALDTLFALEGFTRKVAILGDMLELGEAAESWHFALGRSAARADALILHGQFADAVRRGAEAAGMNPGSVFVAGSHLEAAERVTSSWAAGDLYLVKGSRGMSMERVIEEIECRAGEATNARPGGWKKGT
ncbi:MAG: UDP-N-acetylmuramoyl-tripeptide--D-alanyl-D-alanine ligase [Candidatus Eisenbacteria bacterium]|nr:UDP-N-acetylmuramoyl-tripeptide--D-alanyl-D-alanine ligase [Candidatus Eisenbacteria bacterium]